MSTSRMVGTVSDGLWLLADALVRLLLVALWIGGGAFVLAFVIDRADMAREKRANVRRVERLRREAARLERIDR